ncbi:MAG: PBSX family phage terminase large subunit [Clostridia bacterium]
MILTSKQKEFVKNANHRYNIKIGARRCGKTFLDIFYRIPKKITSLKDEKGLNVIMGVSKETIERNVLQPMRELYSAELVGTINSRNVAVLFGEDVYCLGAEKISQVSKVQGTSIKYLYADELARYHKDVFEMVKGCLDKPYSCFDGALNPESNSHWLKKDFLDKVDVDNLDVYVQHYTIFDNEFLPEEFVQNLCKEYSSAGEHWYKRLIMGEWCNAEGVIYQEYNANEKQFLIEEKEIPALQLVSIGVDYGSSRAKSCFKAVGITRNFEKVIVLEEFDMHNTHEPNQLYENYKKFYNLVKSKYGKVNYTFADWGGLGDIITNGLISYCAKNGIISNIQNCQKGRILERIQLTTTLMARKKIYVNKNCKYMRQAFMDAVWDTRTVDTRLDDDKTSDIDSLDAFEYAIYPFAENLMKRGS